jgi:hypothetical protein
VLYGAHTLAKGVPVVVVESALDALLVAQEAEGLASVVATGSIWTDGPGRRFRWRMMLARLPAVVVAYDADAPGEDAAAAWLDALPNAYRLRPEGGKDPGDMHAAGFDVRAWVREGLRLASADGAAVTVPDLPPAGAEAPGPDASGYGDGYGDGPPPALATPAARALASAFARTFGPPVEVPAPPGVRVPSAGVKVLRFPGVPPGVRVPLLQT